jgi:hypothetical protein
MNLNLIDFEYFIETDINPFILFNQSGKIEYLNHSAEILLGYVSKKELYDIALANASDDFGFKTKMMELKYGVFTFYAINVAYKDENLISIRLYKEPIIQNNQKLKQESLMNTDINTLLEANISLFKMSNTIKLNLLTDTAMPNFKLDQAQLSKLIKKSLELFKNNDSIMITLKIVVGEYIIINKKKEKIIELSFEAKTRDKDDNALQNIANSNYIAIILKDNLIRLNIPFIQDKLK